MDELNTILLDLDGTLVDTAADLMTALNTVLRRYDYPTVTLESVKSMIGDGIPGLVEKGFAAAGRIPADEVLEQAVAQCVHHYNAQATALSTLFPGVKDTLHLLKAQNYKLAVCTNKPERAARHILTELGIEPLLEDIVGGDTLGVRKPDAAHLLGTLKRLHGTTGNAVMVGDSRNDVLAARNAGLPVIFRDVWLQHLTSKKNWRRTGLSTRSRNFLRH